LTYAASGLPEGAVLDPQTGVIAWTPRYDQAGSYPGIELVVSDGNRQATEAVSIHVADTNRPPRFAPSPIQLGREGQPLDFTLAAGDPDGDSVTFRTVAGAVPGAVLDSTTGRFRWTPGFDQAGTHTITFGVLDPQAAEDTLEVVLQIDNTNRPPVLQTPPHAARLGETLRFFVTAVDPDEDALSFSAEHLPEGAVLEAASGEFVWTPGPGQAGEYVVTLHATDGAATASHSMLLRAAVAPAVPHVTVELTPGFPVLPGQSIGVHITAAGLADIVARRLWVGGQLVPLDASGRAEIVADEPGSIAIEAEAIDADQRVGRASTWLRVRDPADAADPEVSLAVERIPARLAEPLDFGGRVADTNLESWKLEIAPLNSGNFVTLATGDTELAGGMLATFDPRRWSNGFYVLRLSASDIGGRRASVETPLEINTVANQAGYERWETDFEWSIGGVTVPLVRAYSSLEHATAGSFGAGWRWAPRDVRLETNVLATGHEAQGVYRPFGDDTRLMLTTPAGQRLAFQFAPQPREVPGQVYYEPAWVADVPNGYALRSAQEKLIKAGGHYYELAAGRAYHPASRFADEADYILTAPDGTEYLIDSRHGVFRQRLPSGMRVYYGDSGIVGDDGSGVRFVNDAGNRVSEATATDGTVLRYQYNTLGQLVGVWRSDGDPRALYAYEATGLERLQAAVGAGGQAVAVQYEPTLEEISGLVHLGDVAQFTGAVYHGSLSSPETPALQTLVLGDDLWAGDASAARMLRVVVQPDTPGVVLESLRLWNEPRLATAMVEGRMTAVFAAEIAGLHVLEMAAAESSLPGDWQLQLALAGDLDLNGRVDGLDSELLAAKLGTAWGDPDYDFAADVDGNGRIDAADWQLLAGNFGAGTGTPLLPGSGEGEPSLSNAACPEDVNHDGQVTELDAWAVINAIEQDSPHRVFGGAFAGAATVSLYDVNGDGLLTPLDVLLVVNYLNRQAVSLETSAPSTRPPATAAVAAAEPEGSGPPLSGFWNGDFTNRLPGSPDFGWSLRGAASVAAGWAVLDEGAVFFSGFRQTLEIPAGADTIRFTLAGTEFFDDASAPPDAFEVALLDAATFQSLLPTCVGLAGTDAVLNVQADGRVFASPAVSVPGLAHSGDLPALAQPWTIDIGIAGVAPGTEATLYFDLLGFGSAASRVRLDDVFVTGIEPPTAAPDQAVVLEDESVIVDVLANDEDSDGSLDASTVTIQQAPTQGAVQVDSVSGTVLYTPVDHFSGTDTFTYCVKDNTGRLSNPAQVAIEVVPVADAPVLYARQAQGNQDTAILLNIAAQRIDLDGSESMMLEISGVPRGAELSVGALVDVGVYEIAEEDIAGVAIMPPLGSSEPIELGVRATTTEAQNGDSASVDASFVVSVLPVL
nr:tandem-95 repeat protein [Pirellulaceae bacterium]